MADLYKISTGLSNVSSASWNAHQSLILTNQIVAQLNDLKQGGTKYTPKNFVYNIATSDAGVSRYNMVFSTDHWETIDLSNANLVYCDIYATSVDTATLTDSGNSVYCVPLASGIWRMYSWGTASKVQNEKRILAMLFLGIGTATDPTGVTGFTSMRMSETTYRDKRLYALHYSSSLQTSNIEKFTTWTITSSGNYTLICDYLTAQEGSASGVCHINMYAAGGGVESLEGTTGGVSLDHRYTTDVHNFTGTTAQFSTTANNLDGKNVDGKVLLIIGSSVTASVTLAEHGSNQTAGPFSLSATAPDTASYPLTYAQIVTTGDTIVTGFLTGLLHDYLSLDSNSTVLREVSYDGGSTWNTVSLDAIYKFAATGTSCKVRWTFTRNATTIIDKHYGYGLIYG